MADIERQDLIDTSSDESSPDEFTNDNDDPSETSRMTCKGVLCIFGTFICVNLIVVPVFVTVFVLDKLDIV
jgi:hypothetical protein